MTVNAAIAPAGAWNDASGLFPLPYHDVRSGPDPSGAVLQFLRGTYHAASELMGWDPALVDVPAPPTSLAATGTAQ